MIRVEGPAPGRRKAAAVKTCRGVIKEPRRPRRPAFNDYGAAGVAAPRGGAEAAAKIGFGPRSAGFLREARALFNAGLIEAAGESGAPEDACARCNEGGGVLLRGRCLGEADAVAFSGASARSPMTEEIFIIFRSEFRAGVKWW